MLEASRCQLAQVETLLGGCCTGDDEDGDGASDAEDGGATSALRRENDALQRHLSLARRLLADCSPSAGPPGSSSAGSPLPFSLAHGGAGCAWDSPAACSDVFSSPFMAAATAGGAGTGPDSEQCTAHHHLTVDYRQLQGLQQQQQVRACVGGGGGGGGGGRQGCFVCTFPTK